MGNEAGEGGPCSGHKLPPAVQFCPEPTLDTWNSPIFKIASSDACSPQQAPCADSFCSLESFLCSPLIPSSLTILSATGVVLTVPYQLAFWNAIIICARDCLLASRLISPGALGICSMHGCASPGSRKPAVGVLSQFPGQKATPVLRRGLWGEKH